MQTIYPSLPWIFPHEKCPQWVLCSLTKQPFFLPFITGLFSCYFASEFQTMNSILYSQIVSFLSV